VSAVRAAREGPGVGDDVNVHSAEVVMRVGDALAGAAAEPADLIREARQRQRRRWLLFGLAVTVVLAGAGGIGFAVASPGHQHRPAHRPRPARAAPARRPSAFPVSIPGSVGTSVLMWPVGDPAFGPASGPPAYLDDLTSGTLSLVTNRPAFAAGDFQPYLIRVGRWLVFAGSAGTMAIADDLRGRQRVLDGRTEFFAPSATPGQVWLEQFSGAAPLQGQGTVSVWQVSVPGGARGPVLTLPPRSSLVAGTDAGLLLEVPQGTDSGLALWSPGVLRSLPYSPLWGDLFDVSARFVAYGTGCQVLTTTIAAGQNGYDLCRVLRVYDLVTGRLFSSRPPPGTAGWVPGGYNVLGEALAPGGARIAAYAATRPLGSGDGLLFVLRLSGPSARPKRVPASAAIAWERTAWSADGSWLFYQGPGQRMWAYQVSRGQVRRSSTGCCGYVVMATFSSRR
jgi:hypothetical protein